MITSAISSNKLGRVMYHQLDKESEIPSGQKSQLDRVTPTTKENFFKIRNDKHEVVFEGNAVATKFWIERQVSRAESLDFFDLRGINLSGAALSGARMQGVDLYRANLRMVDLSWALLHKANMREANLRQA